MDELGKIKRISLVGTIANVVEIVLAIIGIAMGIAVLEFADKVAVGGKDMLESGSGHDLVGGYEILGGAAGFFGGLLGVLVGYALVVMSIFIILYYIAPVVVGISSFVKSNKRLAQSETLYLSKYKADGVVKAVFNGIPTVLLLVSDIKESFETGFPVTSFGILILLGVLFAMSIYQIVLCNDLLK